MIETTTTSDRILFQHTPCGRGLACVDDLRRGRARESRDERVELSGTIYVQPAVDDLSDYRVLQQSRLSTALTENWSLVVELNVRHDSDPELDVDETDLELSTGFGFRF